MASTEKLQQFGDLAWAEYPQAPKGAAECGLARAGRLLGSRLQPGDEAADVSRFTVRDLPVNRDTRARGVGGLSPSDKGAVLAGANVDAREGRLEPRKRWESGDGVNGQAGTGSRASQADCCVCVERGGPAPEEAGRKRSIHFSFRVCGFLKTMAGERARARSIVDRALM